MTPIICVGETEVEREQGKTEAALRAITMTVAEADGVKKLAAPKEEKKAEPTAEIEEPVKRSSKKEEPAPKKDSSAVLAEWDDE